MKFNPNRIILILAVIIIGLTLANYLVFNKLYVKPPEKPAPPPELPSGVPPAKPEPVSPPPARHIPESHKPKIAIVIDDLGPNLAVAEELYRLSPRITLAIMPFEAYSSKIAQSAKQRGQAILLHLPLEPLDRTKVSPRSSNMLLLEEKDGIILQKLTASLDNLPDVTGVNNHMGSRFTEDAYHMELILGEIRRRGLTFLDSRTSPRSVGYETACRMSIPALKRDIFLDNEMEEAVIARQLEKLAEIAKKNGKAIAIGHPHPQTLAEVRKFVAKLPDMGVDLVRLQELL